MFQFFVARSPRWLAKAEHDIRSRAELVLVQAEQFAEAALDLVSRDGVAYAPRRRDADTWTQNIRAFYSTDAGK